MAETDDQLKQIYTCTTKLSKSNCFTLCHYMIKFVSDLQQISVLLRVFRLPSPMTDHHNITEIFLKVALH